MNLKLDIEYKVKNKDIKLKLYNNVFSQKNYQLYAARFFKMLSNKLRWVFVDYHTGTGKTSTSLLMTENKYLCYIIGNQVSHDAFTDAIDNLQYDKKLYNFLTYQSFANIPESTIDQYFQNTVLIIDEFQNLFSQQGLNTYGLQLQKIVSLLGNKIKIICLSGTVLNTLWYEIFYIGNIFKGYDYWNVQQPELLKFNSNEKKECVDYLKQHFLSYHNILNKELYPSLKYVSITNNTQKSPTIIEEDQIMQQSIFPLYMSFDSNDWKTDENVETTDKKQNILSNTHILPKYYNNPSKQVENGTLITDQSDILEYSPISKSFIDTVEQLLKSDKCTKIVGYSEHIQYQWGLLQWAQILDNMGFIKYGDNNKKKTRCAICLECFTHHNEQHNDHPFQPLTYIVYYATLSLVERYEYIKIFNNQNNTYGQQCKIILLSEIAETGLSLVAISDFFLLDNIPGYSQYQQIIARAVRMNSHESLPQDMQVVRVYNLCSVPLSSHDSITQYQKSDNKLQTQTSQESSQNTSSNTTSSNLSSLPNNYLQWQVMFQQGKQLNKILEEIRQSREKIDIDIFKSQLFTFSNLQQIIQFLKGQDFNKDLTKKELKQIILNPDLLKIDFQVKSINEEALDYIYFNIFSQKIVQQQKLDYQNKYFIDDLKPIKYIQQVQGQTILDLIKYNRQISLPQIKLFLKDYSTQIIQRLKTYLKEFDTIFTAWFIYEGFVYIENDEKQFLENHNKFYNFVWDKTFNYVLQHQKKIVSDYNIKGIYYTNKVFKLNQKEDLIQFNVYNNHSVFNKLSISFTSDVPTYQYKNEDFYIFGGKELYDVEHEDVYQTISNKFQIRYNIFYFLRENKFQEPVFEI